MHYREKEASGANFKFLLGVDVVSLFLPVALAKI